LDVLLVCPRDFGQHPTAALIDIRRELASTRRQLARMTRIDQLLDTLPAGTSFGLAPDAAGQPTRPAAELAAAVERLPAAYRPDCLSGCELGFHCRAQARDTDAVEQLGSGVRADLGRIGTVREALAAAYPTARPTADRGAADADNPDEVNADEDDEAAARLARAGALRAEALGRPAPAPALLAEVAG
jgi:hypothetical protein